jgi:hypothetical protein
MAEPTVAKEMLSALTTFGALVGLATGIFTVWDRWVRWRPIAYIIATTAGSNYIRIKNLGPVDVVIRSIRSHPSMFKVAKDHEVDAIYRGVIDQMPPAVIGAQSERDFLFFTHPTLPDDAPIRTVWFFVNWRKASATWLPQVPVFLITTTSAIRNMAKD